MPPLLLLLLLLLLLPPPDPRLTDYDLLLSNLSDLKAGKAAEVSACTCQWLNPSCLHDLQPVLLLDVLYLARCM
jgi:hypothetical protein